MPDKPSSSESQKLAGSTSARAAKSKADVKSNAWSISGAATGLADVVSQGALQGVALDKATERKNMLRYMQRCRHESANAAAANQVLESMKPESDRLRRVLESRQAAAKAMVRNMEEREKEDSFSMLLLHRNS